MRASRIVAPVLAWMLALGCAGTVFSAEPALKPTLDASGAKGAVILEGSSGRILVGRAEHAPLPIASTTKIMTALLTLEQPALDEYFTVDPVAIHVEGSSMGLLEGDQVTLRALAWGMLLSSGNDAANAAATRIAGSPEAFCALMNRRAAELGMKNTVFASPSGLDVGEHHSTAYDLALLARAALQNEAFTEIVSSKSAKVCYGNPPYQRWLTNHNRLLWQCEDCIGIKTGFTKKAGRCLVSAARRDGLTLIAVTLGCPDDFTVHHTLYDRCFESLAFRDWGDVLSNLSLAVTGAQEHRVPLRALWPLGAYLTAEERALCTLSVSVEPFLYAPVEAGRVVGSAALLLDETPLASVLLVAAQDRPARFPEDRSILQRVKDFFARPEHWRFPLNERETGSLAPS